MYVFSKFYFVQKRIIYLLLYIDVIKVSRWRDGWMDEVAIVN
jgi:hypothetical protein